MIKAPKPALLGILLFRIAPAGVSIFRYCSSGAMQRTRKHLIPW